MRITMKRKLLKTTIAATIGIMLASSVHAGNYPNTARTLTGGIGSGTTHGRIPSSHPGTKSRAPAYRNSHAADYASKYRSGLSHRPTSLPSGGSGNPSSLSTGASSSASTHIPSLPSSLPDAASAGRVPTSIPPVSTGGGMPSLPPPLPDAASAGRVPTSIPPAGSGGSMPSLPASIPDAASAGLANRGKGRP